MCIQWTVLPSVMIKLHNSIPIIHYIAPKLLGPRSTTLGSMHSSPSDLSAKICFRSVRLSFLELELNCITQWLISHHTLYSSQASWTMVICLSYAHPQLWALLTALYQICLLEFVSGVCVHLLELIKLHIL